MLGDWPVAIEGFGPVACATTLWRTHGRLRVTVVLKATFDLQHDAPAAPAMPEPIGPGDLAPYVPRADVLFTGHAHAPVGQAVPTAAVRVGIARQKVLVDKTLHVFGDRMAPSAGAEPEPPRPFERMPVVYERAFRGSGFDENPVGLSPAPGTPMPNIVDPADPEGPAGFGPIAPEWPLRRRLLRQLDPAVLLAPAPDIPDAFAWSYFHAAPADQRCAFLHGDEWILLDGLHPEMVRFVSRLPGTHAAARIIGLPGASTWAELELAADTLRIDGDTMRCSITWRGNVPVDAEDALPRLRVLCGVGLAGRPVAWGESRPGAFEIDDEPTQIVTRAQLSAAHTPSVHPQDLRDEATIVAQHPLLAALAARSAQAHWDIEDPITDEPATVARPKTSAGSRIEDPPTIGQDADDLAELIAQSERETAAQERRVEPPKKSALSPGAALRAKVVERMAAGAPLSGMDLGGADLSGLDLELRSLVGVNLKGACLARCRLVKADLSGANLGGADLSDATLDHAVLERADFYGAIVAGASFEGARLTDCNFATARGEGARFIGATGERALFGGGRWAFARFDKAELSSADFTEAVLDDARFDGATLNAIRLYEARAPGASFNQAMMPEARADSANLRRATLDQVFAPDSVWDQADLDDASFRGAMLPGASFIRASCRRVVFSEAELAEARLKRARLEGAQFLNTDVSKATFVGADLSQADLRGANTQESVMGPEGS